LESLIEILFDTFYRVIKFILIDILINFVFLFTGLFVLKLATFNHYAVSSKHKKKIASDNFAKFVGFIVWILMIIAVAHVNK